MCAVIVDSDHKEMGYSLDRVDVLVWAITELMIEGNRVADCYSANRGPHLL